MRTFAGLAIAVLIAVAIGVVANVERGGGLPGSVTVAERPSARAPSISCRTGGPVLGATPSAAHPGEVVSLAVTGVPPGSLVSGAVTEFATRRAGALRPLYTLSSAPPGAGAGALGITPYRAHQWVADVGIVGPVAVRVPDVAPGPYVLVRDYAPVPGLAPAQRVPGQARASLCAALRVRPAPPSRRARDDVAISVSPRDALRAHERARVTLTGFGPGATVSISECAFAALVSAAGCGAPIGRVVVGHSGRASATVVLAGAASAGPAPGERAFACAASCVLVASLGRGYAYVDTPLHFARAGALSGSFVAIGGPAGGLPRSIAGRITAVGTDGRRFVVDTAADGEFSLLVPPGRYRVSGRSPEVRDGSREVLCAVANPLLVRPGSVARASLSCSLK